MIKPKIIKYRLGTKKQYKGFAIIFGNLKIERVVCKNNFLIRVEISNWK